MLSSTGRYGEIMRDHSAIKLTLAFLVGMQVSAVQMPAACARDDQLWDDDPPGKLESARCLLAQSENFKLKASRFHLNVNNQVKNANVLKGQADKLQAGAKEYSANLQAFKDHALLYKAHLDKVELDLGHCKESEADYQDQLKKYSLHIERFHLIPSLPILPPPHICGRLAVSEGEAQHMANSMREDQARLMRSESELAASENKLHGAMLNSARADAALAHRSKLAEEERKLAGEFAALKTEYELLKVQSDALKGTSAGIKSVHGKVKTQH
jgi:hypothetical protein